MIITLPDFEINFNFHCSCNGKLHIPKKKNCLDKTATTEKLKYVDLMFVPCYHITSTPLSFISKDGNVNLINEYLFYT